ncbi:MAG: septum formation initiator family protein [Azospirillaceae bacterium]|nr:septum formation initiator family protein [Azospirillaceae bacterium]
MPVIGACVVGYFAYHAIQGDRGLIALGHVQNQIDQAKAVLAQVRGERERLENETSLLRPDHLDGDMLDERARAVLNYSHPDDLVLMYKANPDGSAASADRAAPALLPNKK